MMRLSKGRGFVRVTNLEGNSGLGSAYLGEEAEWRDDDTRSEQCREKGVGLATGLEENFNFSYKGTSPK